MEVNGSGTIPASVTKPVIMGQAPKPEVNETGLKTAGRPASAAVSQATPPEVPQSERTEVLKKPSSAQREAANAPAGNMSNGAINPPISPPPATTRVKDYTGALDYAQDFPEALTRSMAEGNPFEVGVINPSFSSINDNFGKVNGNKVLTVFAQVAQNTPGVKSVFRNGVNMILTFDESCGLTASEIVSNVERNMQRADYTLDVSPNTIPLETKDGSGNPRADFIVWANGKGILPDSMGRYRVNIAEAPRYDSKREASINGFGINLGILEVDPRAVNADTALRGVQYTVASANFEAIPGEILRVNAGAQPEYMNGVSVKHLLQPSVRGVDKQSGMLTKYPLENVLNSAIKEGRPFTVIAMDVNGLSGYGYTYNALGSTLADMAVRDMSEVIKKTCVKHGFTIADPNNPSGPQVAAAFRGSCMSDETTIFGEGKTQADADALVREINDEARRLSREVPVSIEDVPAKGKALFERYLANMPDVRTTTVDGKTKYFIDIHNVGRVCAKGEFDADGKPILIDSLTTTAGVLEVRPAENSGLTPEIVENKVLELADEHKSDNRKNSSMAAGILDEKGTGHEVRIAAKTLVMEPDQTQMDVEKKTSSAEATKHLAEYFKTAKGQEFLRSEGGRKWIAEANRIASMRTTAQELKLQGAGLVAGLAATMGMEQFAEAIGIDNKQERFALVLGGAHIINTQTQKYLTGKVVGESAANAAKLVSAASNPTAVSSAIAQGRNLFAGMGEMTLVSMMYEGLLEQTGLNGTVLSSPWVSNGVSFATPAAVRFAYGQLAKKFGGEALAKTGLKFLGKAAGGIGLASFLTDGAANIALSDYSLYVNKRAYEDLQIKRMGEADGIVEGAVNKSSAVISEFSHVIGGSAIEWAAARDFPAITQEIVRGDMARSVSEIKELRTILKGYLENGGDIQVFEKKTEFEDIEGTPYNEEQVFKYMLDTASSDPDAQVGSQKNLASTIDRFEGISLKDCFDILGKSQTIYVQSMFANLYIVKPSSIKGFENSTLNDDVREYFTKEGVLKPESESRFLEDWGLAK